MKIPEKSMLVLDINVVLFLPLKCFEFISLSPCVLLYLCLHVLSTFLVQSLPQ